MVDSTSIIKGGSHMTLASYFLLCLFIEARCLASSLCNKDIQVWCKVVCSRHSQDRLQVFMSETTPMRSFANLHQRKESLTQICAAKHAQGSSHV